MSATHNHETAHVGATDELLAVLTDMAKCILEQEAAALAKDTHDSASIAQTQQPSTKQPKSRAKRSQG